MRKIYMFLTFAVINFSLFGEDLAGFWATIDKDTKLPSSVIAVYLYQGKYYGRIIATFNRQGKMDDTIYSPKGRAPGLVGNPYYSGLDIVWDAKPTKKGRFRGYVVDPRDGKTYNAELWKENGNLILRGELFIFGRNEVWPPFPNTLFDKSFKIPDLNTFVPNIPNRSN